ncbi:MAG TPA: PEP-CTERM sorting domain-containing protein [Bryobacteraceae bacterium]|jgi:hypothetical protein|nr:PEP-CTERM sorting domain-containing protein [Bryobacteraceae bacterium]
MSLISRLFSLGAASVMLAGLASANLVDSYNLTSSYNDLLGGPSLTPNGGTLTPGTGYVFGVNTNGTGEGLSLSNSLLSNPGNYSIEMNFEIDTTSGFRKLVDTKNLTEDTQWYDINGHLQYFNQPTGADVVFTPGTFVDLLVNRNSTTNEVKGYVNGVLETDFIDTGGDATFSGPNNIMWFFQDDNAFCGGCEVSSGTVKSIKIFDQPITPTAAVPEPSMLWGLLAACGVTLLVKVRKIASARS